jgi:hypothetical protein
MVVIKLFIILSFTAIMAYMVGKFSFLAIVVTALGITFLNFIFKDQ